jgi:hypothetical protein
VVIRRNHCARVELLDPRVTPLAAASIDDVLVGQDGLIPCTPVDQCGATHGQTGVEELQKDPLARAVVARVGRV